MKKRYTVELTSEQIAFVIRMLHYRISMSDDEVKTAETVINALIGATPIPEPLRLRRAQQKPRTRRQP